MEESALVGTVAGDITTFASQVRMTRVAACRFLNVSETSLSFSLMVLMSATPTHGCKYTATST